MKGSCSGDGGATPGVPWVGSFTPGRRHGRRELPPASRQRVNAPAATAGPGCESRGVASVARVAGAPRRAERAARRPDLPAEAPLRCRGHSATCAGALFSNLKATGGACGPRESRARRTGSGSYSH